METPPFDLVQVEQNLQCRVALPLGQRFEPRDQPAIGDAKHEDLPRGEDLGSVRRSMVSAWNRPTSVNVR
jgi:hypothetical protein